jgi:hypothetical protein
MASNKSESTGKKAAIAAAKTLRSKTASKAEKTAAASALTQVGNKKVTSKKAAAVAAKVIHDPMASKAAKTAAASTLTQKPDKAASKPKAKSKSPGKSKTKKAA